MSSAPPVVTPEVVREIAALARLRVPEAELAQWSAQLARIIDYIDQLKQIPADAFGSGLEDPASVSQTPLRDDVPRPGHGVEALEANAPRRLHGYGVVPRVVGQGG